MRDSDVLARVSAARSALNRPLWIASAVRHTPLTDTLSPSESCAAVRGPAIVMRVVPRASETASTSPTSSIRPVNIRLLVGIVYVAFHRKIDPEAMQRDISHLRSFAELMESAASGKRHRAAAGQNLGSVVKKNFVYYVSSERGPIHQRATFDQHTRHFQLSQPPHDVPQIRTPI